MQTLSLTAAAGLLGAAAVAAGAARVDAGDAASLQQALAAALAAGDASLLVPPGLYNFSALPAAAPKTLDISGASRFSLVSGGAVELVFPPSGGLRVDQSADVSVVGPFAMDAWPLFTTQGAVSDGVRDGKWFNFTLALDEGFEMDDPARFVPSRAIFFNATTRRMLRGQVLAVTSALALAPLGGGAWRVSVTFAANPTLVIPPGGVIAALTPTVDGPNILVQNSTRFAASDVTSYAASGFTILELGGAGGHAWTRINVTRRPGSGRLMASSADVFHSTAVAAGPTLVDSELSFAGDDLFAVHCELGILWRRLNATAAYVIDTGAGFGLVEGVPGDELDFYGLNESMPRLGGARIAAAGLQRVTNATLIAEAAGAAAYIKDVLHVTLRPFPVTLLLAVFDPPGLPPALGDYSALVELPARCGAGTLVRNCSLHDTNGGMRLKGSRVTVADTTVEIAYGMRMLPELFWTQSVSSNITLVNNTLIDCGCTTLGPHAIEYNPDIVGLRVENCSVVPAACV